MTVDRRIKTNHRIICAYGNDTLSGFATKVTYGSQRRRPPNGWQFK